MQPLIRVLDTNTDPDLAITLSISHKFKPHLGYVLVGPDRGRVYKVLVHAFHQPVVVHPDPGHHSPLRPEQVALTMLSSPFTLT